MVALIFRYVESQFSHGFVCVWHNSFTSWVNILWSTTLSFCGQPQTHYVINLNPVLCNLFTKYFTVNNTPLLYSNAPPFCVQQYGVAIDSQGSILKGYCTIHPTWKWAFPIYCVIWFMPIFSQYVGISHKYCVQPIF